MDILYTLVLGPLATNCYFITAGEKAVVIDPADSGEVLMLADRLGAEIGAVVITHGHFDHFAGALDIKRKTGAEIICPDLDREMLSDARKCWAHFMQGIPFEPVYPDRVFENESAFSVCGVSFRVMGAAGHTAGSCLLFCETLGNVIFAGDVIFAGSIGRTDGYSASGAQMKASLNEIAALEGDYVIYSGHGEETTLSEEKRSNPYFGW